MRQTQQLLRQAQAFYHPPARWIQTVAAYFLAWKFFPLEHDRPQAGQRAKCRARVPGRSAAYVSNIENVHRSDFNLETTLARNLTMEHNILTCAVHVTSFILPLSICRFISRFCCSVPVSLF